MKTWTKCLLATVVVAVLGCGLVAGDSQHLCPSSWPESKQNLTYVAFTTNFTIIPKKITCKMTSFGGSTQAFPDAARTLTSSIITVGVQKKMRGLTRRTTAKAMGDTASCREFNGTGVASVIVAIDPKGGNASDLHSLIAMVAHGAELCREEDLDSYSGDGAKPAIKFCDALRRKQAMSKQPRVAVCVKDAPSGSGLMSGKQCFPGDARVTLVDAANQVPAGTARMDELAIGDAVACLVPDGVMEGAEVRDDQLTFRPGVCHVYGYLDADKGRRTTYVHLHYSDASGQRAVLRATADHLIYTAGRAIPATAPARVLTPGGITKRAGAVAVGDLLAVRAADGAGFYTAAVTDITSEAAVGAFAPLLTNAGVLVVDGAVAYPWIHLPSGDPAPHPMTHLGEHFRHTRLWMDFEAARASGCNGAACPCLDAPDDPATRCVRLGDKLADVPPGWSDFEKRSFKTYLAAVAEGRTYSDYAVAIAYARAYVSSPWLQRIDMALRKMGMKPHTLSMWAANHGLTRPAAA